MAIPGLGRVWSRLIGLPVSLGIGIAIGPAIEPVVEEARQLAWAELPLRRLDPETAATVHIRGVQGNLDPADEAKHSGLRGERFDALVAAQRTLPDYAALLELIRRGEVDVNRATTALVQGGLRPAWTGELLSLASARLAPEIVANAIQQGFLPNPGILPGDVPRAGGTIPQTKAVKLDPLSESAAYGVERERLTVLAELAGLPPAPQELLELWRRGIINEADVAIGIAEGRTKTKWTDALKALKRNHLSAATAVEGLLRQRIDRPTAEAIAALSGIEAADFEIAYQISGRPPGVIEATELYNRGAPSPTGTGKFSREDFNQVVAHSDVRPEYAASLWELRYRLPSLFQMRALIQNGAISDAKALEILHASGFDDTLAAGIVTAAHGTKMAKHRDLTVAEIETLYEGGLLPAAKATELLKALRFDDFEAAEILLLGDARRERKYVEGVITTVHAKYIAHLVDETTSIGELDALGIGPDARNRLLGLWRQQRSANVRRLTVGEIRRALHLQLISSQDAHDRYVGLGYPEEDAQVLVSLDAGPGVPGGMLLVPTPPGPGVTPPPPLA